MRKMILLLLAFIISNQVPAQQVITGSITSDLTLTADETYLLSGFVRIENGATLRIMPGTIIFGENTTQGTLIVKPGGKLIAEGTQQNPIVFTSEFAKAGADRQPSYGDWGGIIILGNAPINVPGGTAAIEGPGDTFGGTNPDDSSGVLKYVRIEYPGIAFSLNNEVNGLTFGGVGRKTVIDYVQVSFSGDDSFEWFGGNVNCKHLIAHRGWDDDFDTDFGYNGNLQFLVSLRDPEIADQSSSNGFESDNDGSGSDNLPLTAPTWYNVTLVGPKQTDTTAINSLYKRGMHLRRNSQNKVHNALVMGWPTGLLFDGSKTTTSAVNGLSFVKNSIVSGSSKAVDSASANSSLNPVTWFTGINNGRIFSTNAEVMLADPFNFTAPNFLPLAGSPALSGSVMPPSDGFFDTSADFVGAFGTEDWTAGWANWNPGNYTVTDIESGDGTIITDYRLEQNFPNPFNPVTIINYQLPDYSFVSLKVYDMLGKEVKTLVNEQKEAGIYSLEFDGAGLSSGTYIYSLTAGSNRINRKMILMK